jgi:predicted TIM-barrel fold metal-dependent hydrolase
MNLNDMVIVSVDDHVVETGDLFIKHAPKVWHDKAPKLIRTADGADAWSYEGQIRPNFALNAVAGRPRDELGFEPSSFDQIRKGCWDPQARVDDMNVNGVLSALCFGSVTGMFGELWLGAKDKEVAAVMCRAYNDWYLEEWCEAFPGRFIPLAQLPLWDMKLAVAEANRLAQKGCVAISLPGLPTLQGLPSIHDDYWRPLWTAISDNGQLICNHITPGGGSEHVSMDAPIDAFLTKFGLCSYTVAAEWLWGPTLREFTDINVMLSEGGIGWIPYFLERADLTFKNHGPWTRQSFGGKLPSEFFRERFYSCFIEDRQGLVARDFIGIDTITFENDYPHADITWPNSPEQLWADFEYAKCSPADIDKITHSNAIRALRFDPIAKMGGRDKCTVGALRDQAKHVDLTPITNAGGIAPKDGEYHMITAADMARQVPKLFKESGA